MPQGEKYKRDAPKFDTTPKAERRKKIGRAGAGAASIEIELG